MPANKTITPTAERRLKVLQSLDTLGAGFQLASHDLDIRGAGNLLGDEQSGHIKEVGYELYQQMLEEAVAALKEGGVEAEVEEQWSPQITIGTPVMIPEDYVPGPAAAPRPLSPPVDARHGRRDRRVRRRVDRPLRAAPGRGRPADAADVDQGAVPPRQYREGRCRPQGRCLSFRDNAFANPERLVRYIARAGLLRQGPAGHARRVLARLRGVRTTASRERA